MNQEIAETELTLEDHEDIIADGQEAFLKVGNSLTAIRDQKLYLRNYKTFEDYCQQRWGWSSKRGHQLIATASAIASIPEDCLPLVDNERKARAVAKVPPEKAKEVLTEAAKNGKVTAKSITEAAAKISPSKNNGHAPEPEVRRDSTGYKIPEVMYERFARKSEIEELRRKISDVRCAVEKGKQEMDPIYFTVDAQLIWSELTSAFIQLEDAIPYAVCPHCQGQTFEMCRTCKKRGFLCERAYKTSVTEELKAVRDQLCVK